MADDFPLAYPYVEFRRGLLLEIEPIQAMAGKIETWDVVFKYKYTIYIYTYSSVWAIKLYMIWLFPLKDW